MTVFKLFYTDMKIPLKVGIILGYSNFIKLIMINSLFHFRLTKTETSKQVQLSLFSSNLILPK